MIMLFIFRLVLAQAYDSSPIPHNSICELIYIDCYKFLTRKYFLKLNTKAHKDYLSKYRKVCTVCI